MKSKVKLSTFSLIMTVAVIVLLIVGIFSTWEVETKCTVLIAITVCLIGTSLFYYPKNIETTDSELIIHRQLKNKTIPYSEIVSAERCYPSLGGLRICGSGGFLGYWGYFTDIVIGNYFGYFGDRDQCFLIRLKDGRQYVLSCAEPDEMISFINNHL